MYFSIEGETTLMYGLLSYPLPKYSVAVIQPGAVHTNSNKTSAVEPGSRHRIIRDEGAIFAIEANAATPSFMSLGLPRLCAKRSTQEENRGCLAKRR